MQIKYSSVWQTCLLFCCTTLSFAATPIDLSHQPATFLKTFVYTPAVSNHIINTPPLNFKQTNSATDFKHTQHIRVQQMYAGYPVWGGDAVMHIPNNRYQTLSSNGIMYANLTQDLQDTPNYIFNPAQAEKALQYAENAYQKKTNTHVEAQNKKAQLMVFIDDAHKAHWAFLTSFYVQPVNSRAYKPTYILDATTLDVYHYWDDIKTLDIVQGGGYGGNPKLGKYIYDGSASSYPVLEIQRDASKKICYLQNSEIMIEDMRHNDQVVQFKCLFTDGAHHNVYWDADQDAANGAYSPANDALYVGKLVKEMYSQWYGIPVLTKNNQPMLLKMRVHDTSENGIENAFWSDDTEQMTFGDGKDTFYPFVSLGIAAHEISHGFTHQHSALVYLGQSGGINEAFSDMASAAADFYTNNQNTWLFGNDIIKAPGGTLRYLNEPTQDCGGNQPGDNCSINHVSQYNSDLDVHYSSGVFNKAFYLISNSPGWNPHYAFNVMVQANSYYWTSNATYQSAACGVVKATQDYGYDIATIANAFNAVGIDVRRC